MEKKSEIFSGILLLSTITGIILIIVGHCVDGFSIVYGSVVVGITFVIGMFYTVSKNAEAIEEDEAREKIRKEKQNDEKNNDSITIQE